MKAAPFSSFCISEVIGQGLNYGSRSRVGLMAVAWVAIAILFSSGLLRGQTAHFSGGLTYVGSGFSEPFHVAVDAKGDVFVSDADNIAIYEIVAVNGAIPLSPTIRTLDRPAANPEGIAVDAEGNVYFTTLDTGSNLGNNSVTELVAVNGVIPSSPVVRQLGSGLEYPEDIAVDASGDVFVSDSDHSLVKEFVAVNGSVPASPTIRTLGSGFSDPRGIAVDSQGNVYVSDFGNKAVKEILAVNGTIPASPTIVTLASGFCAPWDISRDGAGNLFVADYCNSGIFKLPAVNGVIQPGTTPVEVASGLPGVEGVAVSPSGILYAGLVSSEIPAVIPTSSSFGSVNVGATGSTFPETFVFDSSGVLGPVSVTTKGASGMDFTNAGTGTCVPNTTYGAGQSCTVNVTFTPKFAGVRYGAVELEDTSGNVIATGYVRGTGVGPQVNFSPGAQTTLGSNFDYAAGVAVDGEGNAYVADLINNVGNIQEVMAVNGSIPANPTIRTLVSGIDCPAGPALDAAGDVYYVDTCYHTVNEIEAVNGSIPASPTVRTLTSQFTLPGGLAVDDSGNVFVLDQSNDTVNEIHAVDGVVPATPTITTVASGFQEVDGIAVDANGNVYVSDDTSRKVFEIHAVNGIIPASPSITSVGTGFITPRGIAVDGVGNVYVAEYFYNTVYKLLAVNGSLPASPTMQTLGTGLSYANGVAVSANGNVFVADYGDARLVKLDYADPPALSFASTPVGSTSADSPQTVTLENAGNAGLSFPVPATGENPSVATNFTLDGSAPNSCPVEDANSSAAGTLAAGGSCALSINFAPTVAGTLSGSLVVTDTNGNAVAPGYASQSIALSGTGTKATPTITWPTPAPIPVGTALSSAQLDATASVPGTFVYSPGAGTVLTAGSHTLTVTFTPTDAADYQTATASVVLTVTAPPSFTLSASPSALTVARKQSGSTTITVSGKNGFNSSVTLYIGGLPKGVTASFSPNATTGSSVLTFAARPNARTGTFSVTVEGDSGSLSSILPISLTVQ